MTGSRVGAKERTLGALLRRLLIGVAFLLSVTAAPD